MGLQKWGETQATGGWCRAGFAPALLLNFWGLGRKQTWGEEPG